MKHFKTSKEIIRTKHFHTYSIWFSQLHFFTCVEIVHNFWDSVEGRAGNGGVGEVGRGYSGNKN